jgi:hypothetical protein
LGRYSIAISSLVHGEPIDEWFTLLPRAGKHDSISGDIHLRVALEDPIAAQEDAIQRGQQYAKERDMRFADCVPLEILSSLPDSERKRQEVMFEFVNTERQYVNDIGIIINVYLYHALTFGGENMESSSY